MNDCLDLNLNLLWYFSSCLWSSNVNSKKPVCNFIIHRLHAKLQAESNVFILCSEINQFSSKYIRCKVCIGLNADCNCIKSFIEKLLPGAPMWCFLCGAFLQSLSEAFCCLRLLMNFKRQYFNEVFLIMATAIPWLWIGLCWPFDQISIMNDTPSVRVRVCTQSYANVGLYKRNVFDKWG